MFDDILKRVEAVDWRSIGTHIYGNNEEIPKEFQNLFSRDRETCSEAIEFLMGGGQDQGSVYDTTPEISAFLLEILKAGYTYPELILTFLFYTCSFQVYAPEDKGIDIKQMRLHIRIYETLSTEVQLYYDFLHHSDAVIREEAAKLLGCFSDRAGVIAEWLRQRYADESHFLVKMAILWSLRRLITNLPLLDKTRSFLVEKYGSFYLELVAHEKNLLLKTEAAREFLDLNRDNYQSDDVPELIIDALVEGVIDETDRDFQFYRQENLSYLIKLPAEDWFFKLNIKNFSSVDAQLIIMVALISFQRYRHISFQELSSLLHDSKGKPIYYRKIYVSPHIYQYKNGMEILKAIADCDAFWEMPGNLLSQFGGLPDDREALRQFIEANPPTT